MRFGPAKLITPRGALQARLHPKLFRLDTDPGERTDLAGVDTEHASLEHLTLATERWSDAIGTRAAASRPQPVGSVGPELQQQLRGLGYIK